ncbi:D protein [Human respirovirus 3]|uniref:D protein n=1 Tax=Human respirovirus 3 TaxID=11216 RepID=A0A7S5WLM2_9MONO|nr:D protein [Human respirovirus 3]QKN89215.1 D protein [Human respirovirus 3]
MESDAKNYQIMDSWEEESRDKSTNISSALNIIEFILSTDPQEDLSENDTINTRTQQLSATIYQPKIKPTETSEKDSGSTDKNRQSGSSHECTTEAKDRTIDQETVQRGPGRRSSSDSRAETVVSGGISRSITNSKNGTQNTEDIDLNEIRKMDKDSIEGKVRQSADVPSEISGSDVIFTTEQSRNSDHGRSLESISTPDTRSISVVTAATPDDEEEILMKNSRTKKSSSIHQEDDKRIKKGGEKGKTGLRNQKILTTRYQHQTTDPHQKGRRKSQKQQPSTPTQRGKQKYRQNHQEHNPHHGISPLITTQIEPNRQTQLPQQQPPDQLIQKNQSEQTLDPNPRHKRQMERKGRIQKRAIDLQRGQLLYCRILV